MWPVTQRYLDTLARNHTQVVGVEVLKEGRAVAVLDAGLLTDPTTAISLNVLSGSVSVDRARIRRNCTVRLLDTSGLLLPTDIGDLLAPFSTELRLWVGVRYWDAPLAAVNTTPLGSGTPTIPDDTELVPVGTFVITDLSNDYPVITVGGYDRMWMLGTFAAPFTVPAGTAYNDAIRTILTVGIPISRLQTDLPDTDLLTPAVTFDANTSIADTLHDLAATAGWQLFADPMGVFVATFEPSVDDPPVLTFAPGQASVMRRPQRSISGGATGGDVYNAVVYTGEGSDAPPVRGYAQDDDPTSLTYVAQIGLRPVFESSPLVTTTAQANLAAKTVLSRIIGVADTLVVPTVPNHALESGDVIRVSDPQQNIDQALIVDSFSVPLRAADGEQTLTCRGHVIR
jgi:hypothetical protein